MLESPLANLADDLVYDLGMTDLWYQAQADPRLAGQRQRFS